MSDSNKDIINVEKQQDTVDKTVPSDVPSNTDVVKKIKSDVEKNIKTNKKGSKAIKFVNKNNKEQLEKTLFVGNLPTSVLNNPNSVKKLFKTYGTIKALRFRSIAVNSTPITKYNQKQFRKVGAITGNLSDEKQSVNAYIVFENQDSVQHALEMNNHVFENRHIRVDNMNTDEKNNHVINKNTIFIGNLPFGTDEEELREYINKSINKTENEEVIQNIHIVRDKNTQKEKGIAFVQLNDGLYLPQILLLNKKQFKDRELRIRKYNTKETQKSEKNHQKKLIKDRKTGKKSGDNENKKKITQKEKEENKLTNDLKDVWERLNKGDSIDTIEKEKPVHVPTKQVTNKKTKKPLPKTFMGQKSKHSVKEMKFLEKKMKK